MADPNPEDPEATDPHVKAFFLATLIQPFEPPADEKEYKDEDIGFAKWVTIDDYRREWRSQIPPAHQHAIDWFLKIMNI